MPIVEPAKLRAALPPGGRLLGLDVGEKTIGLAVSDPDLAVASPLVTLRRGKFTADADGVRQLDAAYRDDAGRVAAEQLAKAGVRLACVLNKALAPG